MKSASLSSWPVLGLCKALHVPDGIAKRFELRAVLLLLFEALVHSSAHAAHFFDIKTWDLGADQTLCWHWLVCCCAWWIALPLVLAEQDLGMSEP